MCFGSGNGELGGNLVLEDLLLRKCQRFHLDDIDATLELTLLPHRDLDRDGIGAQILLHLCDHFGKVGAGAVHLVHERDARHAVLVGLVPDSLALRFHTTHGTENGDHAVDDAQRTLHLDGEIDVAGSVYQIDLVVFPLRGDGCRRDGDTALLLLLHEVHGGLTVVCFTDFTVHAGEVKDTLRAGGFARINMRSDTDISQF